MTALAADQGLWLCLTCEQLHRVEPGTARAFCSRCGAAIHERKPSSLTRSAAFLAAAAVLYIPANLVPVVTTGQLFVAQSDTIMSGVMHLWRTDAKLLATILFIASIAVPALKIATLAFLIAMAKRSSHWQPRTRAMIYRATAYISRWSMVDIYVGAVLVALVQFKVFASVEPAPGAVAFCAVVVLTMLASMSFDPRLTWDPMEHRHG